MGYPGDLPDVRDIQLGIADGFDKNKPGFFIDGLGNGFGIGRFDHPGGQVVFWKHLIEKLRARDPSWLEQFVALPEPKPHPLFLLVPGPIAEWEVTRPNRSIHRTLRDKVAQPGEVKR